MICIVNDEKLKKKYEFLTNLIPVGKREAVSMGTLSKLIGLPTSDVRLIVLNARKNGFLICSGDEGYYFPIDDDELNEYINRRKKYIRTASIALHPFRKALKDQEEGDPG